MTPDEKCFQISIAEFVLQQAALQTAFMKMALRRLQQIEELHSLRAKLEQLPDSEERAAMASRLSDLESSFDCSSATRRLENLLARLESEQEKIGAAVRDFRASLPPVSDRELPAI